MMNGVGGTSLHYWAQSWRLSPWDFKVVSETTRRYGKSRIPAGSTVDDWPFGIEEIERYYDIIEREIGVSGKAGNIDGTIDPRGNIFEARAAANIRCRLFGGPTGTTRWRRLPEGWVGIRFLDPPRSTHGPTKAVRAVRTTAFARGGAVT